MKKYFILLATIAIFLGCSNPNNNQDAALKGRFADVERDSASKELYVNQIFKENVLDVMK